VSIKSQLIANGTEKITYEVTPIRKKRLLDSLLSGLSVGRHRGALSFCVHFTTERYIPNLSYVIQSCAKRTQAVDDETARYYDDSTFFILRNISWFVFTQRQTVKFRLQIENDTNRVLFK